MINNKEQTIARYFIPTDEAVVRILQRRAKLYSQISEEIISVDAGVPYVKFMLGKGELYGVEFEYSNGVMQVSNMKKPPCAPPAICGLIHYQGKIISVLDVEKILNLHSVNTDVAALTNVLVITCNKIIIGLRTGEVEMSDTFKNESLTNSFLNSSDSGFGYIKGIDKGRVSILNVDKLLASINGEGEQHE